MNRDDAIAFLDKAEKAWPDFDRVTSETAWIDYLRDIPIDEAKIVGNLWHAENEGPPDFLAFFRRWKSWQNKEKFDPRSVSHAADPIPPTEKSRGVAAGKFAELRDQLRPKDSSSD